MLQMDQFHAWRQSGTLISTGHRDRRASGEGMSSGGVLSPLLWNLVADGLLNKLSRQGFRIQGYADDLVILVQGKFNKTVKERMQKALNTVTEWGVNKGLNIT